MLDTDGKVIPNEQSLSKHKRVSLKDYALETRPKLEQQLFRSNETLEGMIRDLRQWTVDKLGETE